MSAIAVLLVMAALVLLGGAMILSFRLFAEIPSGPTQLRWRVNVCLLGLILLLASATLMAPWPQVQSVRELLLPALLPLLAGLVLLLFRDCLSLVDQVRRVAVQDRAAVTDVLTGLRPRAYLDSRMEEELSRSRRHGQAISLILMDVDDFASINKAHGHAVGDQVLMEIGEILSRSLRTSDVVVRYAGEELAILATDTPPDMAGSVAERLRRDVEVGARKALREAQGARRTITVSAGVAGIDAGVKAKLDLFGSAERALEQAKRQGKNRVVLAPAAAA